MHIENIPIIQHIAHWIFTNLEHPDQRLEYYQQVLNPKTVGTVTVDNISTHFIKPFPIITECVWELGYAKSLLGANWLIFTW